MKLTALKSLVTYQVLNIRSIAVLAVLGERPGVNLRDVAIDLKLPKASVTRAYDTLVRNKLMKRARDGKDKRDVQGLLTDKGLELIKKVVSV